MHNVELQGPDLSACSGDGPQILRWLGRSISFAVAYVGWVALGLVALWAAMSRPLVSLIVNESRKSSSLMGRYGVTGPYVDANLRGASHRSACSANSPIAGGTS